MEKNKQKLKWSFLGRIFNTTRPDKHGRVFLVPYKKLLVHCPVHALFTSYQKQTSMIIRSPCSFRTFKQTKRFTDKFTSQESAIFNLTNPQFSTLVCSLVATHGSIEPTSGQEQLPNYLLFFWGGGHFW